MYLPPEKISGFLFFEHKYVESTYKEEAHDIITVHRKKTVKSFFGKSKEIELVDTYKFYTQLNELMEDRWYCITKEQYNLIKETYPEVLV